MQTGELGFTAVDVFDEPDAAAVAVSRSRFVKGAAKRAVLALDLIGRDLTAPGPGMRLVGGMTELITLERKLYLATCIDLATREVAGWARADHHRAGLPVAALRMAAGRKRIGTGADLLQHMPRSIGDPLADRRQRGRSGRHRARGECEHDSRAVAHPTRITRARHPGQPLQQFRNRFPSGLRILAQWSRAGGISDDASAGTVFRSDHEAWRTP